MHRSKYFFQVPKCQNNVDVSQLSLMCLAMAVCRSETNVFTSKPQPNRYSISALTTNFHILIARGGGWLGISRTIKV